MRELLWVSYDECSNYGVNETLLRGYTGEFSDGTAAGSLDMIAAAKSNDLSRFVEVAAEPVNDRIEVSCV